MEIKSWKNMKSGRIAVLVEHKHITCQFRLAESCDYGYGIERFIFDGGVCIYTQLQVCDYIKEAYKLISEECYKRNIPLDRMDFE